MILSWLILLVFLLAIVAGLIMVWLGWRGRPSLAEPTCAGCGYDLRGVAVNATPACPECGADLGGRHAVSFGRHARQPKLMLLGVTVALLPVVIATALTFWAMHFRSRGPMNVARRSNAALITDFAADVDNAWVSPELARRYGAGNMTPTELAALIDALVAGLNARPADTDASLAWSGDLVGLILLDSGVSDDQKHRIYEAYYRHPLRVNMRRQVRHGAEADFELEAGASWQLPSMKQIYTLRRLTIDGDEQELHASGRRGTRGDLTAYSPFDVNGVIPVDMAPGPHTLTFDVEVGLLRNADSEMVSVGGRRTSAAAWPEAVLRWTRTATVDIEVLAEGQSPVALFRDDTLIAKMRQSIVPKSIVVEPRGEHLRMTLDLAYSRPLPAPVCFAVFAVCDGREHRLGDFTVSESVTSGSSMTRTLREPLPESVREATVVLRPAPREAEHLPGFERIWDGTLEYERVPVRRLDLETP
ncbi:MAG: hypothetical protein GY715_01180 [Planctomycetes bacterium]|nr:hypothetical protein [Planctomycetota bacterium]